MSQSSTNNFTNLSKRQFPGVLDYFTSLRHTLLIVVNDNQLTLSFGKRPTGTNFLPIESLSMFGLLKRWHPFRSTEFVFTFSLVFDSREIAKAVALEYRELGFRCQIQCGVEVVDVDQVIAEVEPSPLQRKMEFVPCA